MPTNDKPIALFDLDGTLADFDGAMYSGMRSLASPSELESGRGSWFPPEQDNEPAYITARRRAVKKQPGFWKNLGTLPTGFRLLNEAIRIGFGVQILTKAPRKNFPAWAEKVEWCHINLPVDEHGIQVNLVEDKGSFYGRILIDDYPKYINSWLAHRPRGIVLMPAQEWNKDFQSVKVYRCDVSDQKSMTDAFEALATQYKKSLSSEGD